MTSNSNPYIIHLIQILKDQIALIDQIQPLLNNQKTCFSFDGMDVGTYDEQEEKKDQYRDQLENCIESFQAVMDEVKAKKIDLLQADAGKQKELMEYNQELEVKSRQLNKEEEIIHAMFDQLCETQRTRIKKYNTNTKMASTYYRTMMKQVDAQAYFYDKMQ